MIMKNEEKRTLMGTFRDYQRCKCAERRAKMERLMWETGYGIIKEGKLFVERF